MWEYRHTDELYHYGVLGMKWGKRKAQQYNDKANYINKTAGARVAYKKEAGKLINLRDANKLTRAAHLQSKAKDLASSKKVTLRESNKNARIAEKKVRNDLKSYNKKTREARKVTANEFKIKREKISDSRSFGSKAGAFLMSGLFANKTYNSVLAAGGSKNKARAVTFATGWLTGPIGHLAVSSIYKNQASKAKKTKK